MKRAQVPALVFALIAAPAYASGTLSIDINDGFQPVLESLKPRLVKQLGMNVDINPRANHDIYADFNKNLVTANLVLFVENPNYGNARTNEFLMANSQIVATSKVVLWCPNIALPKRVSIRDIIKQANIKSIAVLPQGSMMNQMFTKSVPNLPKSTQLVTAPTSLSAWRMARNKQVQCAVTLNKWLRPTDQFAYVSYNEIVLRGYVNPALGHQAQAKQVLNILGSPLIQPLMMRATSIDLVQNLPRAKRSESNRKAS